MRIKQIVLLIIGVCCLCTLGMAQGTDLDDEDRQEPKKVNPLHANGLNYIGVGFEIGPTLNRRRFGQPVHFGLPVKVYLGREKKGRFLVRTGIHYFPVPSERRFAGYSHSFTTIVPLAIGYRRNIGDWYLEGSLGAALTTEAAIYKDASLGKSRIAYREINYGVEIGKQIGDFDLGLALYNTGPIPFHILCAGIKTSYRIKW